MTGVVAPGDTRFRSGNVAARRHGAYSERVTEPVAIALVEALVVDRPDLARFPEAVYAWARAEAICLQLARYHAEQGLLDAKGNLRGGQHVAVFERLAASHRARLGLDPRSEVELRKAAADARSSVEDLERVLQAGRDALEGRRDG